MSRADHISKPNLFVRLTEAQWQAICSTHHWPGGVDCRREIEQIGRNHWEAQATRAMWVKTLQGKQPAKQRDRAWISIRQLEKALAALADDGLLDDGFPHPDLSSAGQGLEAWLSDYNIWIQPFAGKSNPIQAELEWRLIDLWKRSGGKLAYSRKKEEGRSTRRARTRRGAMVRDHGKNYADPDRPNTPYAPLVDFLRLTLSAILGKTYRPSGIAKMIDRHRSERGRHDPWRAYGMHLRITGII
jgi:hypothetical protein